MIIKDSGQRTEFSTGAVRDMGEDKGDMSLVPWLAVMRLSKHCSAGAKKYGRNNVRKGIPQSSFISSAFRHLAKYCEGWQDEDHLIASWWNLGWAIEQEEQGRYELMDLFWQNGKQDSKQDTEQIKHKSESVVRCCEILERMESNGFDMDAVYKMLRENAIATIGCDLDDDGK